MHACPCELHFNIFLQFHSFTALTLHSVAFYLNHPFVSFLFYSFTTPKGQFQPRLARGKYGSEAFKGINFNNANNDKQLEATRSSWVRDDSICNQGHEECDAESDSQSESELPVDKETLLEGSCRGVIRSDDIMITWETQDSDYLKVELFNRIPTYETSKKVHSPQIGNNKILPPIGNNKQQSRSEESKKITLPPIERKTDVLSQASSVLNIDDINLNDDVDPSTHKHVFKSLYGSFTPSDKITKIRNMLARTPADEYFKRLKRHIDRKSALREKKSITDTKHLQQSIKMLYKYHYNYYGTKLPEIKLPKISQTAHTRKQIGSSKQREIDDSPYQCYSTKYKRKMGKWFCIKCDRPKCRCVTLPSHIRDITRLRHQQEKTQLYKGMFKKG